MIQDAFSQLLVDLSKLLNMDLKPDQNFSCLIEIQDKLKVQLEMDPDREDCLVVGTFLPEIPPGKYREDLLISALKANTAAYPRAGNFGYSHKLNCLVLFELFSLSRTKAENLLTQLVPLVQKAFTWKESILRGENTAHLQIQDFTQTPSTGNIFDL